MTKVVSSAETIDPGPAATPLLLSLSNNHAEYPLWETLDDESDSNEYSSCETLGDERDGNEYESSDEFDFSN